VAELVCEDSSLPGPLAIHPERKGIPDITFTRYNHIASFFERKEFLRDKYIQKTYPKEGKLEAKRLIHSWAMRSLLTNGPS